MAGMIKINTKVKPRTVAGQSFTRIVDMKARPVPMVFQCDRCGFTQDIVPPQYYDDPGLLDILETLILTIPRQSCSMKDSSNYYDYKQCLDEMGEDGILKVPESLQTWLIDTVKKHGPGGILGVDAIMIEKALEKMKDGEAGAGKEGKGGK